jgi:phosphoserine phosphatase
VRLAIFDLDNTLLAGDSDHQWGEYLCHRGLVDSDSYKARNDAFYEDYKAGTRTSARKSSAAPSWKCWINGTATSWPSASSR